MNSTALLLFAVVLLLHSSNMHAATPATMPAQTGYATVNGLRMYYEIHGPERAPRPPLMLLHGGGSTIESNWGRILPDLVKSRQVIAVEFQAHGHTADIDRPFTFEQDADDVASLLEQLHIEKADLFGFSNGGMIALQVAIRHPKRVNKLVLASALFKRSGMQEGFWDGMEKVTLKDMPKPLADAFLKINPDPKALQTMFDRDRSRMLAFKDFNEADIHAIQSPALVLNGDVDVIRTEHALALSRLLPHARLAILPGGHGDYIGEICSPDKNSKLPDLVAGMIADFLDQH